jgi:hypothetical protein
MIDVFIINRDLVTWPKAMIAKIKTMNDVDRIVVVDNDSSYEPCLEWYEEERDIEVLKLNKNVGHRCVWDLNIPEQMDSNYYIVTDPDLDISHLPDDTCVHLKECLDERPSLLKVGLSLAVEDVPSDTMYFFAQWEKYLWTVDSDDKVFYAPVDTTFAYYDSSRLNKYYIGGARTKPPYTAKHIPWYYTEDMLRKDEEFLYYLKNASLSSSLKANCEFVQKTIKEEIA